MIAENIRRRRIAANLTQMQLGALMDKSQQTVASWETGAALPRADVLPKLAQVLHCTIEALFADREEMEDG